MAWRSDDLITSITTRAMLPTSQTTFTSTQILALAYEELLDRMVPLVKSVQEEYYDFVKDIALVSGTYNYSIPTRAIGMAVREVQRVNSSGTIVADLTRTSLDRLGYAVDGFYLKNNDIWLVNDPGTTTDLLRVTYMIRPGSLTLAASAGLITVVNTGTKTVTMSVTAASLGYTTSSTLDLVRASPGFDFLAIDQTPTVVSGSTLTFASLPSGLAVGDYVAVAQSSPVVQLPAEMHAVLAQATACRILEAQGFLEQLAASEQKLARMERDAKMLLSPRVDGEPPKILPRVNTLTAMTGRTRLVRP